MATHSRGRRQTLGLWLHKTRPGRSLAIDPDAFLGFAMLVPETGLEPVRGCPQRFLRANRWGDRVKQMPPNLIRTHKPLREDQPQQDSEPVSITHTITHRGDLRAVRPCLVLGMELLARVAAQMLRDAARRTRAPCWALHLPGWHAGLPP